MEKAHSLGWFETSGRGFEYIDEFPELIKAVTPSDIISVANKYFTNNFVLTILGPQNITNEF